MLLCLYTQKYLKYFFIFNIKSHNTCYHVCLQFHICPKVCPLSALGAWSTVCQLCTCSSLWSSADTRQATCYDVTLRVSRKHVREDAIFKVLSSTDGIQLSAVFHDYTATDTGKLALQTCI